MCLHRANHLPPIGVRHPDHSSRDTCSHSNVSYLNCYELRLLRSIAWVSLACPPTTVRRQPFTTPVLLIMRH